MGVFEHFPYVNYHELNLSWILRKLKELEDVIGSQIVDIVARAGVAENAQAIADLTDTVDENATTAHDEAAAAQSTATTAQSTATAAQTAAAAAQTTANSALSAATTVTTGEITKGDYGNMLYPSCRKVGKVVSISFWISMPAGSTPPSGEVPIAFVPAGFRPASLTVLSIGLSSVGNIEYAYVQPNGSVIASGAELTAGAIIMISGSYIID